MYRNHELPAALAQGQLQHLDELNATRIRNAEYLSGELGKIPGVIPPYCPPECKHVYWFYAVRFDPRRPASRRTIAVSASAWKRLCSRKA